MSKKPKSRVDVDPQRVEQKAAQAAQEEPTTYLESIYSALYEFYQSVLEWIDYLMPAYFKQLSQDCEYCPGSRQNSLFMLSDTSSDSDDEWLNACCEHNDFDGASFPSSINKPAQLLFVF